MNSFIYKHFSKSSSPRCFFVFRFFRYPSSPPLSRPRLGWHHSLHPHWTRSLVPLPLRTVPLTSRTTRGWNERGHPLAFLETLGEGTWRIIPVSKLVLSDPFVIRSLGHLEGEQPYLGDLLSMAISQLQYWLGWSCWEDFTFPTSWKFKGTLPQWYNPQPLLRNYTGAIYNLKNIAFQIGPSVQIGVKIKKCMKPPLDQCREDFTFPTV